MLILYVPFFISLLVLAIGAWPRHRHRVASSATALALCLGLLVWMHESALPVVAIPMLIALWILPLHIKDLRSQRSPHN